MDEPENNVMAELMVKVAITPDGRVRTSHVMSTTSAYTFDLGRMVGMVHVVAQDLAMTTVQQLGQIGCNQAQSFAQGVACGLASKLDQSSRQERHQFVELDQQGGGE